MSNRGIINCDSYRLLGACERHAIRTWISLNWFRKIYEILFSPARSFTRFTICYWSTDSRTLENWHGKNSAKFSPNHWIRFSTFSESRRKRSAGVAFNFLFTNFHLVEKKGELVPETFSEIPCPTRANRNYRFTSWFTNANGNLTDEEFLIYSRAKIID